MANIEELKITEDKTRGKHVADLPTNPSESLIDAQTLQEQFDALPELAIEALNTLIDYLVANGLGEATHNVKTYTSLEQIGIDALTLSAEDFSANITAVYSAMPDNSMMLFSTSTVGTANANFRNSLIAKLNSDLGTTFGSGDNFGIEITKPAASNFAGSVLAFKRLGAGNFLEYKCLVRNDEVVPFIRSYKKCGVVLADGSVSMTGNLNIARASYP